MQVKLHASASCRLFFFIKIWNHLCVPGFSSFSSLLFFQQNFLFSLYKISLLSYISVSGSIPVYISINHIIINKEYYSPYWFVFVLLFIRSFKAIKTRSLNKIYHVKFVFNNTVYFSNLSSNISEHVFLRLHKSFIKCKAFLFFNSLLISFKIRPIQIFNFTGYVR